MSTPLEKIFEISEHLEETFDREEQAEALTQSASDFKPEFQAEMLEARIRKIKRLEADLAGLQAKYKPLIEEMQADMRFHERKIEWHQRAIALTLPPGPHSEFIGEAGSVFYASSQKTKIVDEAAIPLEYCKVETSPQLSLIKDAIKGGAEIPGVVIETSYNLRIGAGGERGRANSRQRAKKEK